MHSSRLARSLALAGVFVAAGIGSASAVPPITTPSEQVYKFTIPAGGASSPITPPADLPVSVTGVTTTLGYRGVGQVSMLHIHNSFLEWTGLSSPAGAAIESGFSGSAGTHIVWIDYSQQVDLEVNAPNSFVVHNGSGDSRQVVVTLMW